MKYVEFIKKIIFFLLIENVRKKYTCEFQSMKISKDRLKIN